jgi:hypothetical protein
MLLVLWDVDGTLVRTAGHGRFAFEDAFRAVVGRDPEPVHFAGRTDRQIVQTMLGGRPGDAPRILEELAAALDLDGSFDLGNWSEDLDMHDVVLAFGNDVYDSGEQWVIRMADHDEAPGKDVIGPSGIRQERPGQPRLIDPLRVDGQRRCGSFTHYLVQFGFGLIRSDNSCATPRKARSVSTCTV